MITIEKLYDLFRDSCRVTTDSRDCQRGSIFFALRGENFNGNKFAAAALENGCGYAVVDDAEFCVSDKYILVNNALETLQALARHHRLALKTPIVCITGTNGKTTSKELTAAVLSKKYNVHFTQGNLNNHIGVPLTLLRLKPEHEMAVVEIGANHLGEIKTLANIACPDSGLITNVGKAHLEGFGSLQGVIRAKCELYDYLELNGGTIFVNANNQYLMHELRNRKYITYGVDNSQAAVSGHVDGCSPFVSLSWSKMGGKPFSADTHFIGAYNAENMLAAITVGLHYGVDSSDINDALRDYVPTNNRSQLKKTEHNTLIIDAYNANPTSMEAAIKNFKEMKFDNKVLILGDMLELGEQSQMEHAHIVSILQTARFKNVILVGKEFCGVNSGFRTFEDSDSLKLWLKDNPIKNSAILIKGSHGIGLQNIIDVL